MTFLHPNSSSDTARMDGCPLCEHAGGFPVWADAEWRVIRVDDDAFPAFYRLVARDHVRELSDLSDAARHRCIDLVCAVERALLAALLPTKINLASLGNVVSHLHWHVIARFDWDSRFPAPLWAEAVRSVDPPESVRLGMELTVLDDRVREALASVS